MSQPKKVTTESLSSNSLLDDNARVRLLSRIKESSDGCWIFTGDITKQGYGRFWYKGKLEQAHRAAYKLLVGPIEKETLDHLCKRKDCVNPEHLEPCTRGENARRGNVKSKCSKGHPYTKKNTYLDKNGWKYCRACGRERARARRKNAKKAPGG